jgi:hypothetical protein
MTTHDLSFCEKKNRHIPRSFVESLKKKLPLVYFFTIGYSGHGKTCFLSSLFYFLYHFVVQKWQDFSLLGLNQETLDKLHKTYIDVLEDLRLPAKTPIMFPEPLILKAQKVPFLNGKKLFSNKPQDLVLVFYDAGGGTFDMDQKITENLPVIKNMPTLVFLIDLPGMLGKEPGGKTANQAAERKIHGLLNVVHNAIEKLGQQKKKKLIICFTKADLMAGDEDRYGPLATWLYDSFSDEFPGPDNLEFYLKELLQFSRILENHFALSFPLAYNTLKNNFKEIYFSTFSALGSDPEHGTLKLLEPKRIFDPLFLTLLSQGHLKRA